MKRSELNEIIQSAIDFMDSRKLPLPPFAYWKKDDWKKIGNEHQEIVDNMLGWDITDFGSGDFKKIGLLIFAFRNGNFYDKEKYPKPYAEKLLLVDDGQELPYHFHWKKMEDIINRGGGNLLVELHASDANGEFIDEPVTVTIDGTRVTVKSGEIIKLKPGESITLKPGQYHRLIGEAGTGKVMLFEVSSTNDDTVDNRFHSVSGRFPSLVEDVEPTYLIFKDYEKYIKF
ncbi:MAG TPA: D-lyxose/D-mannose family sugar isomerase [Firmicutes bacterium]|nr:D-lyxose/D-mannose family sugar isomerase [Bacillota bacterium]